MTGEFVDPGWAKRWARLYLAVASPELIPASDFLEILTPILRGSFRTPQSPSYYAGVARTQIVEDPDVERSPEDIEQGLQWYRDVVVDGPFAGMGDTFSGEGPLPEIVRGLNEVNRREGVREIGEGPYYIHAIKWNLEHIPGPVTVEQLAPFAVSIRRELRPNLGFSFRPATATIMGDRGVPPTPPLPPPPVDAAPSRGFPWGWVLGLGGLGLAMMGSGKRRK